MKPSPRRYPMLLTHGAAILVGCLAGKILLGNTTSTAPPDRNTTRSAANSSAMDVSSAWLDESLREVRVEKAKYETTRQTPLTIAELLKKCREEADAERKEYSEQVDEIVENSIKYANEPDPAAAIRRNMRADRREDNHSLEILQAWLDKDTQAALAEVGRNWSLMDQEDLPLMLVRKFGREWLTRQVADDGASYRLRLQLADWLGQDMAWEGGLDGLVNHCATVADPNLKMRLFVSFSSNWPGDDPVATAKFMGGDLPGWLRDELLEMWRPPTSPFGPSVGGGSFPTGVGMAPPKYATREWFEALAAAMNPESLPEDLRNPFPHIPDEAFQRRLPIESLEQTVNANIKSGDPREKAEEKALSSKVWRAMNEGTDLVELYGDGRITRSEFLAELTRRIPGAEAFPDALAREAWRRTSMTSDPQQVAAWAAELSTPGDTKDLMPEGISTSNIYGDPRIPRRLDRYRIFTAGMDEGIRLSRIRQREVYEWGRWSVISPVLAAAWRDALPAGDRLREAILEEEEQERKEKETP